MSFISGLYFRGDPKQKPKQWGPAQTARSIVLERVRCFGIDPYNLPVAFPFWEDAGNNAYNYGSANLYGYGYTALNWDNFKLDFSTTANKLVISNDTWTTPSIQSGKIAIACRLRPNLSAPNGYVFNQDNSGLTIALLTNGRLQYIKGQYSNSYALVESVNDCVFQNTAGGYGEIYVNNKYYNAYNSGVMTAITAPVSNKQAIGGSAAYALSELQGSIDYFFIFGQKLSSDQISLLHDNPYFLFQPPVFRTYFDIAPSGLFYVNSIAQGHGVGQLTIGQNQSLLTSNITNSQVIDAQSLSQGHGLLIDGIDQSHIFGSISLTQLHELITNYISQGQYVDSSIVQLLTEIFVNDVLQGQSSGGITLSQIHDLVVNNISHSQSIDVISIEIPGILVVYNVLQGQSSDGVTLTQKIELDSQSINQSQTLYLVSIEQLHAIVCDNVVQGQEIDSSSLRQLITLAVNSIAQGQTMETMDFSQVFQLDIDNIDHPQSIGALNIDQLSALIVDNINNGQIIEAINFSIANGLVTVTIRTKQPGVTFYGKQPGVTFN